MLVFVEFSRGGGYNEHNEDSTQSSVSDPEIFRLGEEQREASRRSRVTRDPGGGSVRVLGSILRPPGLPPYTDAITPAQRGPAQDPIQVSQNSRISILNNFPPLSVARIHDPW